MLILKFVPVWVLNPLRLFCWLALSASLFLWGSYIFLWRLGVIKYACMQEFTPAMNEHLMFVYHPLVGIASEMAIMLSGLVLSYMILELKFGSQSALKEGFAIIRWIFRNPAAIVPLIAAGFYFYGDLAMSTRVFSVHPGLWIITFFAPVITLFAPGRHT